MANQLVPASVVAKEMADWINSHGPKQRAELLYTMQTVIGGFPRDKKLERKIAAMPDDDEPKGDA